MSINWEEQSAALSQRVAELEAQRKADIRKCEQLVKDGRNWTEIGPMIWAAFPDVFAAHEEGKKSERT